MQINYITKKEYGGGNETILEEVQELMEYASNEWMTFLQAKQNKMKVKKGEKGVKLQRVVKIEKKKKDKKVEQTGVIHFVVFNKEQVEMMQ